MIIILILSTKLIEIICMQLLRLLASIRSKGFLAYCDVYMHNDSYPMHADPMQTVGCLLSWGGGGGGGAM